MTMWKLAWMNFRQSVKNYLSLVVSLPLRCWYS